MSSTSDSDRPTAPVAAGTCSQPGTQPLQPASPAATSCAPAADPGQGPVPFTAYCAAPITVPIRAKTLGRIDAPWADGVVPTPAGNVPRVRTALTVRDRLGMAATACAIRRMDYRVEPGLYSVGEPTAESAVLVTANYKVSFDHLRRELGRRNLWILVLDTKGINVWCAAGKGTFGTAEVVLRLRVSGLTRIVSHRRLILPQLGAPGVAAHQVREATGFHVTYGPVRAADLPAFLDARLKATDDMRRVRFGLRDRLRLAPVEMVMGGAYAIGIAATLLLLAGLNSSGYSATAVQARGIPSALMIAASFVAATVLGPALLPWLPGRAFAVKGAALGSALVAALLVFGAPVAELFGSRLHAVAWAFLAPAFTSFIVMNFTGSSTFTSLSGVLLEMRYAIPLQITCAVTGLAFWVAGLFIA